MEVSVTNKQIAEKEKTYPHVKMCVRLLFSIVCRVSWSWIPHDADANLDQVVSQGMEWASLA